jgi:hypothetical protein
VRRTIAAALLGVLVCALAAPAQAQRPYENLHFTGDFVSTGSECGMPVRYELDFRIHVLTRVVPDSDGQAFFGMENFRSTEVVTNTVTGRWMVVDRAGSSKEIEATHLGGTIWAFDLQQTGSLYTLRDSTGKVVLRDRGRLTLRGVFDTLGDSRPGGIILSEEVLGMSGQFPGFDEAAACEVITRLIG